MVIFEIIIIIINKSGHPSTNYDPQTPQKKSSNGYVGYISGKLVHNENNSYIRHW